MSYNGQRFLEYQERQILDHDNILRGTQRRHKELKTPVVQVVEDQEYSEYERNLREDEYLKKHNV